VILGCEAEGGPIDVERGHAQCMMYDFNVATNREK